MIQINWKIAEAGVGYAASAIMMVLDEVFHTGGIISYAWSIYSSGLYRK